MPNKSLTNAKQAKNDEFYTQLNDVARELSNYRSHFRGKSVFCNCDDPAWSAFWKYFHLNFNALGLARLVSTHYARTEPSYMMVYEGGNDNDCYAGIITPLEGNGDFRNAECLKLMDEADIVVTNPPFSLFREYMATLMEHNKKFLILGNKNAITYKEIFPLIRENKIWLGYNNVHNFLQPDNTIKKFGNIGWFTNLENEKRNEKIILYREYDPNLYPKYDNYDAIEVGNVCDIPMDYERVMGVPITFLDKYCPEQFEIIGATESEGRGFSNGLWQGGVSQATIQNCKVYKRIFIQHKPH